MFTFCHYTLGTAKATIFTQTYSLSLKKCVVCTIWWISLWFFIYILYYIIIYIHMYYIIMYYIIIYIVSYYIYVIYLLYSIYHMWYIISLYIIIYYISLCFDWATAPLLPPSHSPISFHPTWIILLLSCLIACIYVVKSRLYI